ncbi:jun dimerization protein 2-like [Rhineura floridana]|uniref:jun dimerization protein 2-like n=1 Tax=Rhineura floridana TaxID=261503 RepID=UPI002AC85200|nr:jun dimerization protein 2-like [Rhineura floridana]
MDESALWSDIAYLEGNFTSSYHDYNVSDASCLLSDYYATQAFESFFLPPFYSLLFFPGTVGKRDGDCCLASCQRIPTCDSALPGLGPLTGLPGTTLTAEELKYADIRNIGAMISPLHFMEVKLGKRPQPVKSELDEEEERRKRRREKNRVAVARCWNKKKERTEFLQRESERLELMNAKLKAQIEELKQKRQQLILMLTSHQKNSTWSKSTEASYSGL